MPSYHNSHSPAGVVMKVQLCLFLHGLNEAVSLDSLTDITDSDTSPYAHGKGNSQCCWHCQDHHHQDDWAFSCINPTRAARVHCQGSSSHVCLLISKVTCQHMVFSSLAAAGLYEDKRLALNQGYTHVSPSIRILTRTCKCI